MVKSFAKWFAKKDKKKARIILDGKKNEYRAVDVGVLSFFGGAIIVLLLEII